MQALNLLALVLLPIVAAAVQAAQPGVPSIDSSPPIFTNNGLNEHNVTLVTQSAAP